MQAEILGNADATEVQNGMLFIKAGNAEARVWIYSPSIIRVCISKRFSSGTSFAVIKQPTEKLVYSETEDELLIDTGTLLLRINKKPLRFIFFTADGRELSADDERFGAVWQGDRVITHRKLYPDEKFIGLGEKTGDLNRRGCNYVNWNSDVPNHTPSSDPLYQTFPFFIGLHSGLTYGLFFDNAHKSYFDFGASTDESMSWFGADGGDMNYYFFGSQSVAGIIEDYTWLTGRMEMPPLWSLGYQQCRWSYMSAAEVLKVATTFREKQISADVMYCDIDYMEGYKIFTWNKETFADPKGMMDKLKALNFHLVTIVDPGIKIEEGYKQYDEGVANNYFATYPNGEKYIGSVWPGRCHFPDFFNAEVRKWWGESFKALTETGVDGFWNDMNEPAAWGQNIPWIVKFGDHYLPEIRNAYGMQMAKATYEGTKQLLDNKRPFVLTRAAYAGTQRYSAVWTGDNSAYDAHMLLGQRMVNSLGLTGMSFVGVDIGGFSGEPTPQLMARWNSLGVYTPMFRNHAMIGTRRREPWEWEPAIEAIIKKDIELRYRLLPYIYSSFYQSCQTGMPLSRTLAINYTQDENVFDVKYQNQFLFGDAMLVAPVESDQLKANVYLPAGKWYRLSTGKKFTGGKAYNVPAPLTDLPVFIKAGAIITMQSIVQNTAEKGNGILELNIWYDDEASNFVYYEDDGVSYNYQKGNYYKREICFHPATRTITLLPVEGTFPSKFVQIRLVLHGYGTTKKTAIKKVNINGISNAVIGNGVRFDNQDEEIRITY